MTESPLAEGRELKYNDLQNPADNSASPLAEGRELKCYNVYDFLCLVIVAPRGGA